MVCTMEFLTTEAPLNLQPNSLLLLVIYSSLLASLLFVFVTKCLKRGKEKRIPPGDLGLPLIGETLQFLNAFKSVKAIEWVAEKVAKFGPIFKTSIMGCPTVVITGQAGNRFLFQNDTNAVVNKPPASLNRILGQKNILGLSGEDHKRIRGAIMQFLKPEALQKFVGRMDSVIQQHFIDCWDGRESVTVEPLTKKMTFQVACDLLFGLKGSEESEKLGKHFTDASRGFWSLPLNLPGTAFHGGLKARARICKHLASCCEVRRGELEQEKASASEDLMSCMLSMRDENNKGLTEEEILDNMIAIMSAGHDTTSTLLVHMVRFLALHPNVYENIYKEQMEIVAGKQLNEVLRWGDIQKMKYTWKAAQETLRLFPPAFGGFRKAIKDVQFGDYTIPKGWQLFWASSTHMNEETFKEPTKFDPSHFDRPIPPYNFIAFGAGPRVCPGYEFAKMETLIFMHHLVTKYKWCMVDPDEKLICDPFILPAMGLPIKLQSTVK